MEQITFDPKKLIVAPIDCVSPNDYNPKDKNTPEYERVKKSIEQKGQRLPVVVREVGKDKFEIIDGEQRFRSCLELGHKTIALYNEGKLSDREAKELTIAYQQQVPFNEVELAYLIKELTADPAFQLPYNTEELDVFKELADFDLNKYKEYQLEMLETDGLNEGQIIVIPVEKLEEIQKVLKTKDAPASKKVGVYMYVLKEVFKFKHKEMAGIKNILNKVSEAKQITKSQAMLSVFAEFNRLLKKDLTKK